MKQVLLICIFISLCPMINASGTGGVFGQQIPSDYDGGFTQEDSGFTQETVYQQQFTPSQPTSGSSNSWATPGSFLTQKPADFGQLAETGT